MRIDGLDVEKLSRSSGIRRIGGDGAEALSATSTSQSATVSFSPNAQQVKALHEAVAQAPSLEPARVESLKREVDDGSYHVDSNKLATAVGQVLS